jgi:hypothetical protein
MNDAVGRRILQKGLKPKDGDLVGIRLNLNLLRSSGICVHSVHKATSEDGHTKGRGFYRGVVITYLPCVHLKDVWFSVDQRGRESIASGLRAKHPMASIDGNFLEQNDQNFDGVKVGFNPMRTHLFLDEGGFAIEYAQDVTVFEHRAYARGRIRYYTNDTAPKRAGNAPSCAKFHSRDEQNKLWLRV